MVFDRDPGFSHGWHLWSIDYYDEDDNDNDDDNDDDDDYSCISVNFQASNSRFFMEVDLDNTYNIMLMKMMIMMIIMMIMMMKMIIDLTQSIF